MSKRFSDFILPIAFSRKRIMSFFALFILASVVVFTTAIYARLQIGASSGWHLIRTLTPVSSQPSNIAVDQIGRLIGFRTKNPVVSVAWNSDGTKLATLSLQDVNVFDPESGTLLNSFPVQTARGSNQSIAFVSDHSIIIGSASSSDPKKTIDESAITEWDIKSGQPTRYFKIPETLDHMQLNAANVPVSDIGWPISVFAVSKDYKWIIGDGYLFNSAEGIAIRHWRFSDSEAIKRGSSDKINVYNYTKDWVKATAISPDSRLIAFCMFSGRLILSENMNGSEIKIVPAYSDGANCNAVSFSPAGDFIVTAGGSNQVNHSSVDGGPDNPNNTGIIVKVWRTNGGSLVATLHGLTGSVVRSVAIDSQSNFVLAADGAALKYWAFQASKQNPGEPAEIQPDVALIALSSAGELAAVDSRTNTIAIFHR